MKFSTVSGLELEATMPNISGGQYFVRVNSADFQLNGDKLKTLFSKSVAPFLASINRDCPTGLQSVALQIDAATQKNMIDFITENAPSVKNQNISGKDWNNDSGITYHGTYEMWNGVRMD